MPKGFSGLVLLLRRASVHDHLVANRKLIPLSPISIYRRLPTTRVSLSEADTRKKYSLRSSGCTLSPKCRYDFLIMPTCLKSKRCLEDSTEVSETTKRVTMPKKIGTHNGTFHCDEALACFLLQQLPEYKNSTITRTRDQSKLDTCDVVVDVGGVFDPSKFRFDHHQRTFNESMNSLSSEKKWTTKLSSAGLVYFHFGVRILELLLEMKMEDTSLVKAIFDKVYENFIEEIDGIDNGINQTEEKPKYIISTNLSSRVSHLNPTWNDTSINEEEQFKKAMALVGEEFLDRVMFYKSSWIPARELVLNALKERREVDESGEIIWLKSGGCPWKDHLITLEEEMAVSPSIKYVLYTDQSGKWRIQCVPVRLGSFENRVSLPEEWRGIRDNELCEKSGISGCIFVHAGGFIGGNETYEGVLQMAQVALKTKRT